REEDISRLMALNPLLGKLIDVFDLDTPTPGEVKVDEVEVEPQPEPKPSPKISGTIEEVTKHLLQPYNNYTGSETIQLLMDNAKVDERRAKKGLKLMIDKKTINYTDVT